MTAHESLLVHEFHLRSASPLFFGAPVMETRATDETYEQFQSRVWPQKVRVTDTGQVHLNPFAVGQALEAAGQRLGMKLKGNQTYTKLFRQGVVVQDPPLLEKKDGSPLTIKDVKPLCLFVPVGGKRGDGSRVNRLFPQVLAWRAMVRILCFDGRLTEPIVRAHMEEAGKFIGFGSLRVERGGVAGRFFVD